MSEGKRRTFCESEPKQLAQSCFSNFELMRLPFGFKSDEYGLLSYQEEAIKGAGGAKRYLINLGVGSGKTLVALALFSFLKEKDEGYRCIYITEHGVVRQVERDYRKFFSNDLRITTLFKSNPAERVEIYKGFLRSGDILAITYENIIEVFGKKARQEEREAFNALFQGGLKTLLVVDEATNIKNYKSLANKALWYLSSTVARTLAMTGTPVMKNLMDVYNIVRGVGMPVMPIWKFNDRYCLWEEFYVRGKKIRRLKGHKNVDEFWEKLKPYFYTHKLDIGLGLRFMRYDVALGDEERGALQELYNVYKGNPPYVLCAILLNNPAFLERVYEKKGIDYGVGVVPEGDSGKFKWFRELVEEKLGEDEKVVVYSPYLTVVNDFLRRLGLLEAQYAKITGDISDKEGEKERFIKLQTCRYLFITDAGAKGLDGLQSAARHIVFLNLPVSSGQYVQVIGRLFRVGSSFGDVVVHVPLVEGSIDEDIYAVVQSELHLIASVNPEQLLDRSLLDEGVALGITYGGDGLGVEEWLKERIWVRRY